jgi:hypothetical protein
LTGVDFAIFGDDGLVEEGFFESCGDIENVKRLSLEFVSFNVCLVKDKAQGDVVVN